MLRGVGAKRLAWLVAAALTGALLPGGSLAADVDITANTSAQVSLDAQVGSTVEVAPGVIINPGPTNRAIYATIGSWALTNRGSLSASGLATVELKAAGSSVINYGSITSPNSNGVLMFNGGTVDNKAGATISGSSGSSAINIGHSTGGAGTVTNAGTLSSTGGTVILAFGGSVTNLLGGSITTTGNGSSAVTVLRGASRLVSNSGTILSSGGSFATGVTMQTGDSTLINTSTGSITGTFNGVYGGSDAALTLTNSGAISATGPNLSPTNQAYAVEADGPGSAIINAGTITSASSSGVYLRNSGSVTNGGTITGAVHAIQFNTNNFNRSLTLDTGSVLNGDVLGSTGTGIDSLVLKGTATESAAKFTNFETLSMQGAAWTLSGNTTFATSGEVQAGTLTVTGNLTTPVFSVRSGGTLTGTGTIIGAVGNSGTIKVAAGQTFNIVGNTTFNAGSTLAIGVTPSTTGLLALGVGSTANLSGTVNVLAGAGLYATSTSYTILTAPTISGTFSGLTSSSVFLTPSLIYNPTSVVLQLSRSLVSFSSAGNTPNEIATGTALDTLPTTDPLIAPLATLSLTDAARAFDQLSGEAYASAQSALANDSRYPRDAGLDQVDAAFAAIDALKAGRRTIWGQTFGSMSTSNGDGNAAALGDATGGLLIGMDGLLPDNSPVSLFGGFSASHFTIADRGSDVATQSFHLGATAGHEIRGFRLKGGLAGSLVGITVDRKASFAGFSDSDSASYAEATGQLFAELSYAITADRTTLEPFGRIALVGVLGGDYAETGGDAALRGHSSGYGLALATLGLSASTDFALADDLTVQARGRIGLQQGFGGAPTATNQFTGSDSFTVAGVPAGGTTLLVEAELSANLTPATDLTVGFSAAMGSNGGSGGVKAKLSGQF